MQFARGHTPWNKGRPTTPEQRERLSKLRKGKAPWNKGIKYTQITGDDNHKWKGDKVGYFALHAWVSRMKGKAFGCVECGTQDKDKKYEWANISGKYKRDVDDYRNLCTTCHRKESYLRGENKYYFKGVKPPRHAYGCKCFRCTGIPWNKGVKGKLIPWNKGKKTGLVPRTAWKKGYTPKGSILFKKGHIPWNKKI